MVVDLFELPWSADAQHLRRLGGRFLSLLEALGNYHSHQSPAGTSTDTSRTGTKHGDEVETTSEESMAQNLGQSNA